MSDASGTRAMPLRSIPSPTSSSVGWLVCPLNDISWRVRVQPLWQSPLV
jgi:hypothetical protein